MPSGLNCWGNWKRQHRRGLRLFGTEIPNTLDRSQRAMFKPLGCGGNSTMNWSDGLPPRWSSCSIGSKTLAGGPLGSPLNW